MICPGASFAKKVQSFLLEIEKEFPEEQDPESKNVHCVPFPTPIQLPPWGDERMILLHPPTYNMELKIGETRGLL